MDDGVACGAHPLRIRHSHIQAERRESGGRSLGRRGGIGRGPLPSASVQRSGGAHIKPPWVARRFAPRSRPSGARLRSQISA